MCVILSCSQSLSLYDCPIRVKGSKGSGVKSWQLNGWCIYWVRQRWEGRWIWSPAVLCYRWMFPLQDNSGIQDKSRLLNNKMKRPLRQIQSREMPNVKLWHCLYLLRPNCELHPVLSQALFRISSFPSLHFVLECTFVTRKEKGG